MLIGILIGALLGGGLGALIATSGEDQFFMAGGGPVSEDQVRTKLQADGWAVVQLTSDARYIQATAAKAGQIGHLMIDSLTGQLIADDRDDDER
jgi:hypothetical protein